jgi:MGT family glycosyltransferase
VFPVTSILEELCNRGHDVTVCTLDSLLETMRSRGFHARPIDPAIEALEHDAEEARTPVGVAIRATRVFRRRAEHEAVDLRRAITDLRPDLLLVDINTLGALAVAEVWGGPWASWCPYLLPLPSRDAPPFGPGFRPARGPIGRLRDAALRPVIYGTLGRIALPAINEARRRTGLPRLDAAQQLFTSIPLVLSLTAESFDYPRSDWPHNVRLVGPCEWEPPADPPGWLEEIDAPIVLVATSSEIQPDDRLVRCALEVLPREGLHVIATVPARNASVFDIPRNAHVVEFLPHGPILDRAACAVTHGGMGVTQKALARGVPVCAVPFGRDQREVARRLEVSGAGTRLPLRQLSPRRLRDAVGEAMRRRAGAARVAGGYRAAGGPAAAADALEALVAGRDTASATPAPRVSSPPPW